MKSRLFVVVLVVTLATASAGRAGDEPEAPSVRLDPVGGWATAPDGVMLIVSIPSKGELVHFDTTTGKEMRRLSVGFKATALALQGGMLFAAELGSSVVYALDLETGKESKRFSLPGEPVQALTCHPAGGPVFAANLKEEVLAIDPAAGTFTKTPARGRFLAMDPRKGEFLYTGTSRADEEEYLEVKKGPDETLRLRFVTLRGAAAIRKYAVRGTDLKFVAGNANAGIGEGSVLNVSPDGKRVALVTRDGWQAAKETRPRGVIAVFSTADLTTMVGQVETGAHAHNIAFHSTLNLGAALQDNARVLFFDATSLAARSSLRLKDLPHRSWLDLLTFADKGKRLVVLHGETLTFLPLEPASAPPVRQPKGVAGSSGAVRPPIALKDKRSPWVLEPVAKGMAFLSDRDYAITNFPPEMAGSTVLVRTSQDNAGGIGSGLLTALDDGTAYAAIMYEYNGQVRLNKAAFHQLTTEGWEEVEGKFTTVEPGNESWKWKVVKRPVPKGNVYLNLKTPPAVTVFFFKRDSGAAKTVAPDDGGKQVPAARAPGQAIVSLNDKRSPWLLETLEEGMAFASDRAYAILKFPAEMAGSMVLVRPAADLVQPGIGSGQLTALQDGTIYAAIVYEYNRELRLSKAGFQKLAGDGWQQVAGDFRTTDVGNEDWKWKVVKQPLEKGNIYVNFKISATHTIFFFKPAEGKSPPKQSDGPARESTSAPRSPVAFKDKRSPWLLEPLQEAMPFLSDRDYAILKFPSEMAGSTVLVRNSEDTKKAELPSGVLTAEEDVTVYAAILYEYNGQVRVSPAAFRILERDGWQPVDGFKTIEPGSETWKWKVVKGPLQRGNVSINLKVPPATTLFFFKAQVKPQAAAPAKAETEAGSLSAEQKTILLGRWSVQIGPEFQADWTFQPDGTVRATKGPAFGRWISEKDRERILITWEGTPGRAWESLRLPLNPQGTVGETWYSPNWRVRARKIQ